MKHRPENRDPATHVAVRAGGLHRSGVERRPRKMLPVLVALLLIGVAGVVSVLVLPGSPADSAAPADQPRPTAGAFSTALAPTSSSSVTSSVTSSVATSSVATSSAAGCSLPSGTLTVVAAPGIAELVQHYWTANLAQSPCRLALSSQAPADALAAWTAAPGTVPDVWIPDSAIWTDRATKAGLTVPAGAGSVAVSPVVLALSATASARISPDGHPAIGQVLASRLSPEPIRVGLSDPSRSLTSAFSLIDIEASVAGTPDANAALSWALRSTPAAATGDLANLATDPDTAVPSSEQAVVAYNRSAASPARAVYAGPASALDYPFVITDPAAATVAGTLLTGLRSDAGRALISAAGFRYPDGTASGFGAGVDATAPIGTTPPTEAAVDAVVRDLAVSNEPARLLAVVDVSGSMAADVPGAGGASRLDLAKAAAIRGLSLYSPDSEIGVWSFSRHLDGDTDYREQVPVGLLSATSDGRTGRDRINTALTDLTVRKNGDTGLYDTTLVAIRSMRANWEPGRVNSVLLLTDGKNDDPGSMSLEDLLSTIAGEQDPARPVPVIAIAMGPDSDVQALQQITAATSGATYTAVDPRQIGEIFLDAVGQRICRPNC